MDDITPEQRLEEDHDSSPVAKRGHQAPGRESYRHFAERSHGPNIEPMRSNSMPATAERRGGLLSFLRPRPMPDPTGPHETRVNSVLRPVVFGANDGLVSNLALVMGVAGASPPPSLIVLAGIAGLIAGAFSMGVGEYISVQSQRELLEFQLDFQRHQLHHVPEQEERILADIYRQRGFTDEEAAHFAATVLDDHEAATRLLIFEEVGLDERSIGSALQAGVGSFISFSIGALIPLAPYLLLAGTTAFLTSLLASLGALFALGLGISILTRRAPVPTAMRQLLLGGVAAAVTYAVGSLIGVSV